jgi:hypothetical protein
VDELAFGDRRMGTNGYTASYDAIADWYVANLGGALYDEVILSRIPALKSPMGNG